MRNKSIITVIILILTSSVVGYTAASDDIAFTDIAPKNSLFVVAGDNFDEAFESLKGTSLWELWETTEIQEFVELPIQTMLEDINEEFDLDLERDEFPFPTGIFGMAIFPVKADSDDEEEYSQIGDMNYLFAFDFGDKAPTVIMTLMDTLIERMAEDDVEIEIDEFEGRLINSIIAPEPDKEAMIEELKEMMGEEWDDMYLGYYENSGYFDSKMPDVHFVLDDTTLLVCTDLTTIEDVLLGIDGEPRETIAANETFQQALAQVGGRGDVYAVGLLPEPDVLEEIDPTGMVSMMLFESEEMLEALGVNNIKAVGMNFSFDEGSAMVEVEIGVYMPEGSTGLFDLLLDSRSGFNTPDWLDPEAQSLTQINFDFKGVVSLIRDIIESLPEEERESASGVFETTAAGIMTPLFEVLGPQIHIMTWPSDNTSFPPVPRILASIDCQDAQIVSNTIVTWAAPMGIVSRDFLGYRIFSDEGGYVPIAIGVGKERVFIGTTDLIEQVLRADADTLSLAEEPHFKNAAENLPNNALFYNFTSVRPTVESWIELLHSPFDEEAKAARIEEMRQWYEEMDMADSFDEEMFEEEEPDWYDPDTIPDTDLILRYIGDIIGHVRKMDDGFIYKTQLLEPIE